MEMISGLRAKAWFVWRMLADPRDALTLGGKSLPAFVYAIDWAVSGTGALSAALRTIIADADAVISG